MTRIIQSLAEVSADYDVLFCDLWGCLHNGLAPFPAAVAALRAFRGRGGRVVLLTNAPRPSADVRRHLAHLGVPEDCHDAVVSSGDAAQGVMFSGAVGRRVWAIAGPKDEGFFAAPPPEWRDAPPIQRVASLDEAEGIVCTGLADDLTETPEDYRDLLARARARDLPMLCANPDIVVDLGERRLYCAGALAELYEQMGGRTIYSGKPHAPIYDLARRRLGLAEGAGARILAVGDGIDTDIRGAAAQGIDAIFITGGLAWDQFGADPERPDPAGLEAWLAIRGQHPRYAMGRLR